MLDLLTSFSAQFVWLLVLAAIVAPVLVVRRRVQRAERRRIGFTGKPTCGTVVESWKDAEGWNITYEFMPDGMQELIRKTETFEAMPNAPATVGQRIKVAYEPFRPFYSVPVMNENALHIQGAANESLSSESPSTPRGAK